MNRWAAGEVAHGGSGPGWTRGWRPHAGAGPGVMAGRVRGWPARRVALAALAGVLLALLGLPVLAHPPTTLIPAAQTIAIGDDASVAAHDVEAGVDAIFRVSGPIQPIGRCPEQDASAQHDHPNRGYYNSIWITGCEPGGTGEVRLVERNNESNVIARATVVVVRHTYPSHIRNLTQTTQGDGSLGVSWDAPRRTGGSAIVGYGVQHRRDGDSWASEVPATRDTSGTGTSHTITGLTNGQRYHIRVTPCNQQSGCLPWSEKAGFSHASVSGTPRVPTPPPVTTPGPVRELTLTPGDHQLGVRWLAPSSPGGHAISRYQVEYKPAAATAWTSNPEVTDGTATTVPVLTGDRTPLTNGAAYHVQVRACNGSSDSSCGSWTQGEGTPEAPRPRNVDVSPLRERKVRLTWTWMGPAASAYVVSARGFGVGKRSAFYEWRRVHIGSTTPSVSIDGKESTYGFEFYLYNLYRVSGQQPRGLQNHRAFELEVQAVTGKDADNNDVLSAPSDAIILIDTPIRSANGKSSGTLGEAVLTWNLVKDILDDDSYAGGTAWFRYRRAPSTHAEITWLPEEANFTYVADVPETLLKDGRTLQSLALNDVYAIQFWYEPPASQVNQPAKLRVFAGRDVYVWPSTRPAAVGEDEDGESYAGERVASYPLNYPLEHRRRDPKQTYVYRICDDTFPDLDAGNTPNAGGAGRARWEDFIFDAFDRWRVATDGLVVADYERGPCATYTAVVDQAVRALGRSLPRDLAAQYDEATRRAHVQALVDQSRHLGTLRDAVMRAAMTTSDAADVGSEVFMYESSAHPGVFEFGKPLQPGVCSHEAYGCARRRVVRHATKGWLTDIALRKQRLFETESGAYVPEIPTVRLDLCLVRLDVNEDDMGRGHGRANDRFLNVYSTLVHEVGHAFGIREGDTGSDQEAYHPNDDLDEDSVMVQPNRECAPTPLDVLAIYALYQHTK